MKIDLYDLLRVHRDAPLDVIRRAYRKAASEHHPDKGGDPDRFALVILARDVLLDEARRKQYDDTGATDDLQIAIEQVAFDAICMAAADLMGFGLAPESANLLAEARALLQQQLANIRDAERKTDRAMKGMDGVRRRLSGKDRAPSRLAELLETGHDRARQNYSAQREVVSSAIELLNSETFTREQSDSRYADNLLNAVRSGMIR